MGGALLVVVGANISGMSKGEVERIWLPFALVGPACRSRVGDATWNSRRRTPSPTCLEQHNAMVAPARSVHHRCAGHGVVAMVILVTGGAGFIGSFVVDALVDLGHEVRVVDALHPSAHVGIPVTVNPDADYRWGDLADLDVARDAVSGVSAVCHQASMVGLGVDFGDVRNYVHHNDLATASLLQALHEAGYRSRVVLASSMVVYGEGGYVCTVHGPVRPEPRRVGALERGEFEPECPLCARAVEAIAITESDVLDPRNVYAATKVQQEYLCSSWAREHDASVIVLRYHNVYGPRMPTRHAVRGRCRDLPKFPREREFTPGLRRRRSKA